MQRRIFSTHTSYDKRSGTLLVNGDDLAVGVCFGCAVLPIGRLCRSNLAGNLDRDLALDVVFFDAKQATMICENKRAPFRNEKARAAENR